MRAAGADGCRAGWICITRDLASGRLASACLTDATSLVHQTPRPDALAIDIPIGLPERGARDCDREARRRLGRRGSSVFPAPIRPLLAARSWHEACAIRERVEGKRISKQVWGILGKIRDVDAVLRALPDDARRCVREVHPELSFLAWTGQPMAHAKKKRPGREERLAVVAAHYGGDAFAQVRAQHRRRDVPDEDVLDAFAALWTAERLLAGTAQPVPEVPPRDREGLPMEILA